MEPHEPEVGRVPRLLPNKILSGATSSPSAPIRRYMLSLCATNNNTMASKTFAAATGRALRAATPCSVRGGKVLFTN